MTGEGAGTHRSLRQLLAARLDCERNNDEGEPERETRQPPPKRGIADKELSALLARGLATFGSSSRRLRSAADRKINRL